jgi:uncharacterized protein
MKRRGFIYKSLLTTGAISIATSSTFSNFDSLTKKQNFNFMIETHPNLTLINDFFKAYAENSQEGLKKIIAEDIKWHIPGTHPLSGTKIGLQAVLEYFNQLGKGKFKAEPIVMGFNDNYVIDCHRNWSNLEGGDNLDNMSCLLWRIENHKIVEVHNFPQNQQIVDLFFSKLYK